MRRRGFGLVIALTTITVVGATVSLMMLYSARIFQQRRQEQARTTAQLVLDSGVAYAQSHRQQLRANPPAQRLTLPAGDLVAAPAQTTLSLQMRDAAAIRVHATVVMGTIHASEEITVPFGD